MFQIAYRYLDGERFRNVKPREAQPHFKKIAELVRLVSTSHKRIACF